MSDYEEAHRRFLVAVEARDRLEAEWWLSQMKAAVAAMAWERAARESVWSWVPLDTGPG